MTKSRDEDSLKDSLIRLNNKFVAELKANQVKIPQSYLLRELKHIISMSGKYGTKDNEDRFSQIAKANEPLYQRYRIALYDMWRNFAYYFNSEHEDSKKIKMSLEAALVNDGVLIRNEDTFYANIKCFDKIRNEFQFPYIYQLLRLKLNRIEDEDQIIQGLYRDIENASKNKKTESEKLVAMNSQIMKNLFENDPEHPMVGILKSYCKNPPYLPQHALALKVAYKLMEYADRRSRDIFPKANEERIASVTKLANSLLAANTYNEMKAEFDKVSIPPESSLYSAYEKMKIKIEKASQYEMDAQSHGDNSAAEATRLFNAIDKALNGIETKREEKLILRQTISDIMRPSRNESDATRYAELRAALEASIKKIDKSYHGMHTIFVKAGYGSRLAQTLQQVLDNESKYKNAQVKDAPQEVTIVKKRR